MNFQPLFTTVRVVQAVHRIAATVVMLGLLGVQVFSRRKKGERFYTNDRQ